MLIVVQDRAQPQKRIWQKRGLGVRQATGRRRMRLQSHVPGGAFREGAELQGKSCARTLQTVWRLYIVCKWHSSVRKAALDLQLHGVLPTMAWHPHLCAIAPTSRALIASRKRFCVNEDQYPIFNDAVASSLRQTSHTGLIHQVEK